MTALITFSILGIISLLFLYALCSSAKDADEIIAKWSKDTSNN